DQVHAVAFDAAEAQDACHRLGALHAQGLVQFMTAVAVAVSDHSDATAAVALECLGHLAQGHQPGGQQRRTLGMEVAVNWDQHPDLLTFSLHLIALLLGQGTQTLDTRVSPGGSWFLRSLHDFLFRRACADQYKRRQHQAFYGIHSSIQAEGKTVVKNATQLSTEWADCGLSLQAIHRFMRDSSKGFTQ